MRTRFDKKALIVAVLAIAGFIYGVTREHALGAVAAAPVQAGQTKPAAVASSSAVKIEDSVVRVFATKRMPDIARPWTKQPPMEVTGSGLVIEGKRILTNAHVVLYAVQVQIQGSQAGNKISAKVEVISPEMDLAILKLDDESFFDTHPALSRASVLPQAKDAVMVYGFPTGGTSLSITKGIVSRTDFVGYNYGVAGLRIQIDAAVNPGNSGGPAVAGEQVIGLAFSALSNAQNIGYIIPSEEIELFLKDAADGKYDGKPAIYDDLQTLENDALRAFLKLDRSVEGVVVHEPYKTDPAYPLKKWDVITKIGDMPVDSQGSARLDDIAKINFAYYVQKIVKNNLIPLTIMRQGAVKQIQLPVSPKPVRLIKPLKGEYPSYFIIGPMVFSIAAEELVNAISGGNNSALGNSLSAAGNLMFARRSEKPAFEGEQLVIAPSALFTHNLSKGYHAPALGVVKSINDIKVKNLLHLIEIIRDAKEEYLIFEFSGQNTESLVFTRKDFLASTEEVLNDNGIRAQGSADAMAVWNNIKR
jgi:S1-C subfamily serine protease